MEYDISKLYADGDPDYFDIMYGGSFVGACDYDSENAIPFLIADGELHIGDRGIGHVDMGCNYESDEFSQSDDFVSGRLWLKINDRGRNNDFPYAVLSFWWGSEEHMVNSRLVDELLQIVNVGRKSVLVASFEENDYGKMYPYSEWSFKISKANDKQKEVLATHLMNAKDKYNATSDFRSNRDRVIYTPRERAFGTMAAYHNATRAENIDRIIKSVLKEYIYKDTKRIIF